MRSLTLSELQSLSLDTLIGRRDLGRVRLPTPAEIEGITGDVGQGRERGVIAGWRLIAVEIYGQPPELVLLGDRGGSLWGTSPVRAVNRDRRAARTLSGSIYGLEEPGSGEPAVDQLLHLAFLLESWGGGALDLPAVGY